MRSDRYKGNKDKPASHPAPTVNATRGPVERDVSTQLSDAQRTAQEQLKELRRRN